MRPALSPVHAGPMTTPFDYDADPERFRLASRVTRQHLLAERSLYERLAELLVEIGARRVLDVGCGEGALRAALPARLRLVGLDASWTMLGAHPRPVVQALATALPFPAGVFDAVVAINVLDHLADPTVAVAEAHRVLARRGSFVAATASRHDSPELAHVWRPPPAPFDAEDGPALVASVFGPVEVRRWDAPTTGSGGGSAWWNGSPRCGASTSTAGPSRRPRRSTTSAPTVCTCV